MKTFKDNAGRIWTLSIDVAAIKRVRSLIDVDLMSVVDGKLMERLISDPVLLCDVVYCTCKPEADAKCISDEDFGKAMAGDAMDNATSGLLEELVDFFPQARRRLLGKALKKFRALEARALEVAEMKLDGPELEAEMEAALASATELRTTGDSSGSLQELQELTPGR